MTSARKWLILVAISTLFGIVTLRFGADASLDVPLRAEPATPPAGDRAPPAPPAASPAGAGDVKHAPRIKPEPIDPGPASVIQTPPRTEKATPPVDDRHADRAALLALVRATVTLFERTGATPREAIANLATWIAADAGHTGPAIDFLFAMPDELAKARPFLFQALLDAGDGSIADRIRLRIRDRKRNILASLPRSRADLFVVLASGEREPRRRAINGLAAPDLKDACVLAQLRTIATDPAVAWEVRHAAIRALGRSSFPGTGRRLLDLLAGANPIERRAVLRSLARHADNDPLVTQALMDNALDARRTEPERRLAVSSLARSHRHPRVKELLLHLLRTDADVYMRRCAVQGLGRYRKDAGMIETLAAIRHRERDPEVLAAIGRLLRP